MDELSIQSMVIILRIGDVVHRYLMDDDYVLLNRQPSLWASSIQAMRVKRVPEKSRLDPHSIQLNVEITAGFNADFDGDEMCLYAVQSVEARAEMKYLMSTSEHLLVAGNGVIQDSALGVYVLSVTDRPLEKALYFDCIMWMKQTFFCANPFQGPFTSRRLLSILFPENVNLEGYVENIIVVGALTKKKLYATNCCLKYMLKINSLRLIFYIPYKELHQNFSVVAVFL